MNINDMTTTAEIEAYVGWSYNMGARMLSAAPGETVSGRLPLEVAEVGPLMERSVQVAGSEGLTLQELRRIFAPLGKERFDRGLKFARESGRVTETRESRPNKSGRPQMQVVLYASDVR